MLSSLEIPTVSRAGARLANFRFPLPTSVNRWPDSSREPPEGHDDLAKFGLCTIDEHPQVDRDLIGLALITVNPRDEHRLDRERLM